jgi:hypothetical protein
MPFIFECLITKVSLFVKKDGWQTPISDSYLAFLTKADGGVIR